MCLACQLLFARGLGPCGTHAEEGTVTSLPIGTRVYHWLLQQFGTVTDGPTATGRIWVAFDGEDEESSISIDALKKVR
jgi:hypothetical protein